MVSFDVRESTTASASGLSGPAAIGTVTVGLNGATVAAVQTPENLGVAPANAGVALSIVTSPKDAGAVKSVEITGIADGSLISGSTPIASGTFITVPASGTIPLTYIPQTGFVGIGSFSVQESTTGDATGLSGPTASAQITVVGAPTNLAAMPSSNSALPPAIALTWAAPPVPVTSYIILRGTSASGPFTQIGSVTGTATGFTDNSTTDPPNGVVLNTTYYYEVEAVNGTATSSPSGIVSATVDRSHAAQPRVGHGGRQRRRAGLESVDRRLGAVQRVPRNHVRG